MARPTKLTPKVKKALELLYRKGCTDVEVATAIGVDESTLHNWHKRSPAFFQSIKDWKAVADEEIERSLRERALGYSHPEDKIFNDNGSPLVVPTIKHYPPDPTSMIFWLKNRQPAKWRDKQDIEIDGNITIEVVKFCDEDKTP